jgi:hypothetical protein
LFLFHKWMLFNFNPLVCICGLIGHWLVPGMLPMSTKTLNFTQIAKPKSAFGQKKKHCDSHLYRYNNTILLNLWNILDISPPNLLSWWFNKAKFALPRKKSTHAQLLFFYFSQFTSTFSIDNSPLVQSMLLKQVLNRTASTELMLIMISKIPR